uniref:Peptidoglycan recognition protein n=1 Tax=Samia ricini TaxID=63990 RepID=A7BIV1_SAMRI|nr:peptidoglycan recognition protein-D [Samia ricini]
MFNILSIGLFVTIIMNVKAYPSIFSGESVENEVPSYDFPFVSRSQWSARQPNQTLPLKTPVPYVVIHHSYIPAACHTRETCCKAMRSMQNFHMDGHQWWDIGYHFGVSSDGTVYEGRGWSTLGAHALHFNSVSIGICLIGDWRVSLPPADQIKATKSLIAAGVELGYISPQYKLVGHRQVRATECPGDALYENIKTWTHYSAFPSSVKDLIHVKELPESFREELIRNRTKSESLPLA